MGITDLPEEMFGKLMSISDELMWRYFELLSFRSMGDIETLRRSAEEGANPRDIKYQLALEIVARFHSSGDAQRAQKAFVERFQKGALPTELNEVHLDNDGKAMPITQVMRGAGLVTSTSEGFRLIEQGAVRIDGERVSDRKLEIRSGTRMVLQVGKRRVARIHLA